MAKKPEEDRQTEQLKYLEDVILREYDFRAIKRIRGKERVWRVLTDRGERFLKLSRCNSTELSFVRQVLEHVANHGFRRVSRFILTKYGDPFIEDQGNCYYLTDWIEGKTCSFSKPAHLEEAVFTLAEFHRAASGFELQQTAGQPAFPQHFRQEWGRWPKMFSQRGEKIRTLSRKWESGKQDSQMAKLINGKAASVYAWAMQASRLFETDDFQELVDAEKADRVVSHGAYTGSNIIISKKGSGAFAVDLDHCLQDVRVFDLAKLLAKVMPQYNWDVDISMRILGWYGDIRPLDERELRAIVGYLAFPHRLYRYFRRQTLQEINEKTAGIAGKFQEDYQLEEVRKQFLHQLVLRKNLDINMEI